MPHPAGGRSCSCLAAASSAARQAHSCSWQEALGGFPSTTWTVGAFSKVRASRSAGFHGSRSREPCRPSLAITEVHSNCELSSFGSRGRVDAAC